jgi:hypothetical protein
MEQKQNTEQAESHEKPTKAPYDLTQAIIENLNRNVLKDEEEREQMRAQKSSQK